MQFDPMTGKPIEENEDNEMNFDPMTGEPINKKTQDEQPIGFDPMTGEPIYQKAEEQQPVGFDPMTGEPIYQKAEEQQPTGFDPMTGEAIYRKSEEKPEKKPKYAIIGGIAVAVVAVVAVIFVMSTGLFMGKAGRILVATANTLKDSPKFVEALEGLSIIAEDKFTISASCEYDGAKVSGELRSSNKEKQIYALLSSEDFSKFELWAGVDSKSAKVWVPDIYKKVFVYKYTDKNKGYLMDSMSDDEIEELNSLLKSVAEGSKDSSKVEKQLRKVIKNEFKNLKITNASKEIFTVNDKDVNCKGYEVTFTEKNMMNILDGIEDVIKDNYEDIYDSDIIDEDYISDFYDELRDDFDDMEDIELTFYIYRNKLAAIILDTEDDDDIQICFEGGDYRTQNMQIKSGFYKVQLKGADDGTEERLVLRDRYKGDNDWSEIAKLNYNYDSGDFSVSYGSSGIEGELKKSKSELEFSLTSIKMYGDRISPEFKICISKGAKFDKYDGKTFDLGNASEDDFEEMLEEVQDKIYDKDLDGLFGSLLSDTYGIMTESTLTEEITAVEEEW